MLFKVNLIFKDFSRQSCIYSSTFQACANPERYLRLLEDPARCEVAMNDGLEVFHIKN